MTDRRELHPALNDLMDRHATTLFHFLCRMLGNEDDANDLAQETSVRVFRHRSRSKADGKFSTWLYTILQDFRTVPSSRFPVLTSGRP